MNENGKTFNRTNVRRLGLALTLIGLFLFILGARPDLFDLDRSEVVGFVQVGVFTFGLLLIVLGGTYSLGSLWPAGCKTIAADIGLRLAWTGFVVALASAMADVFGLGTRPITSGAPFFGFWQERGVLIGQIVMIAGFLLMIPYKKPELPPENVVGEEEENRVNLQLD